MPEVTLHRASTDDLPFVTTCASRAYSIYVARIGKKPAPMVADFATSLESGQLEIILADSVEIGFVVSYPRDNNLFIENIALDPEQQGKGHGQATFASLEARARTMDLNAIELYTNEKMTENLSFYPRLGFDEVERRNEAGFNRVYFRKTLK